MTTITRDPFDLPKDQIMDLANEAITRAGGPNVASVHFKFTCDHCGSRQTFEEPNAIYASGACGACGKQTEIRSYGLLLIINNIKGDDHAGSH